MAVTGPAWIVRATPSPAHAGQPRTEPVEKTFASAGRLGVTTGRRVRGLLGNTEVRRPHRVGQKHARRVVDTDPRVTAPTESRQHRFRLIGQYAVPVASAAATRRPCCTMPFHVEQAGLVDVEIENSGDWKTPTAG